MLPDRHFDLVYTKWVLQHLPDEGTIAAYISELMRVLKEGGLLAFQVRTHLALRTRLQVGRRVYDLLRMLGLSPSFIYTRLKQSLAAKEKPELVIIATPPSVAFASE